MSSPQEPPAPVLAVIDKCVSYVLKNGLSFEEKLQQADASGQFSFLSPSDPHHQYYRWRYEQKRSGGGGGGGSEGAKPSPPAPRPRDFRFLTPVPPVSRHDLDVIKAVARYTACNGGKHAHAFLRAMERRGKKPQFAFMNRSHTLNGLYEQLTAQYRSIVDATGAGGDPAAAFAVAATRAALFARAYGRAAFEKNTQMTAKNEQLQLREEQLHFASIDWQDVAFVAKVNFDAVDEVSELPAPTSRMSVVSRALASKSRTLELQPPAAPETQPATQSETQPATQSETQPATQSETQPVETQSETQPATEPAAATQSAPPEPAPPAVAARGSGANPPKGIKIRAAGESRLKKKAAENAISCPITGQMVPESHFDTHLKVLLRDPRYKEQQDNFVKKNFTYESNLTTDQVYENIKRLVRKRNQSEEETEAKRLRPGSS